MRHGRRAQHACVPELAGCKKRAGCAVTPPSFLSSFSFFPSKVIYLVSTVHETRSRRGRGKYKRRSSHHSFDHEHTLSIEVKPIFMPMWGSHGYFPCNLFIFCCHLTRVWQRLLSLMGVTGPTGQLHERIAKRNDKTPTKTISHHHQQHPHRLNN